MGIMLAILTITIILWTLGSAQMTVNISSECQCKNSTKTLHQRFCDDEFVVSVVLHSSTTNNTVKTYEVLMLSHHKKRSITKEKKELPNYVISKLFTDSFGCGLTMEPNDNNSTNNDITYVLGGKFIDGKHWVSFCNTVVEGAMLPCVNEDYNNCDCKIINEDCTGAECKEDDDACIYKPKKSDGPELQNKVNGWGNACLRDQSGKCKWKECP